MEGLRLVFLETQQLGLPIIGTDSGAVPEAIGDEVCGFVVEESSPGALRDAIEQLATSPDLYRDVSERAVEFVEERLSWERCVGGHVDAYRG
jgi:glycosyltransferase involved in cell wall biosynthesis